MNSGSAIGIMECGGEASAHAKADASALQRLGVWSPLPHRVGEGQGRGKGLLLRAAAQPDQTRQTRAQRQHARRLWNHHAAHLYKVVAQRAKSAVCAR